MTFQQIDDSAFDPEKPLDVALLKDVENNYAAALQARTRGASCTFDLRDKPRWCCVERGVCPILWHLSPNTNEVTVRVRGNPDAAAAGSTLGVYILPLDMVHRFLPDNEEEVVVSGTSGTNTYTLTLDTSRLEGWVFIGLTFKSDRGTAVQLTDTGTGKGYDVFESSASPWTSSYLWVNNTNSHYTSGHEVPCAAVQLYDSSAGTTHGNLKQIIRVESVPSPSSYRLWVYPPFLRSGFQEVNESVWNSAEDYAEIIPLGSLDVRSIQITETGVNARPSLGGMTDTARPTAATILHRLYARGEHLFRECTRVHHVGPTQYGAQEDAHFTGKMLAKAGHVQGHTDAWTTLRGFVVGGDSPYRLNSTLHRRTMYTVAFYFFLTHYDDNNGGPRSRPHSIRMRLVCSDLDGITNTVTGSAVTFGASGEGVASWAHRGITNAYQNPPPAHLGAFHVSGLSNDLERGTLRTHALRHGLQPAATIVTGTDDGWWYRATLTIRDEYPDDARALYLQVLGGGSSLDGVGEDTFDDLGGRHIHVPTITVISTPLASLDGASVGVAV